MGFIAVLLKIVLLGLFVIKELYGDPTGVICLIYLFIPSFKKLNLFIFIFYDDSPLFYLFYNSPLENY